MADGPAVVGTLEEGPPAAGVRPRPGTAVLLSLASVAVGATSYALAVLLLRLVRPEEFTAWAGSQTVLTVTGTAAAALLPLPLSRALRRPGTSPRRQVELLGGALTTGLLGGTAAAAGVWAVTRTFLEDQQAGLVAVAAGSFFLTAPLWGWLQGRGRMGLYAVLVVTEAVTRVLLALVVAVSGGGLTLLVSTWLAASALVLALGAAAERADLTGLRLHLAGWHEWRENGRVGVCQVLLAVVAGADVYALAAMGVQGAETANYQLLATVTRAPVYLAAAIVIVRFPLVGPPGSAQRHVREGVGDLLRLVLPAMVLVGSAPPAVVAVLVPGWTGGVLLPLLAAAGVLLGVAVVTCTLTVADGRLGLVSSVLLGGCGVLALGIPLGLARAGHVGVALAVLGAAVLVAAGAARGRVPAALAIVALAVLALGVATWLGQRVPVLWWTAAVVTVVAVLARLLRGSRPVPPIEDGLHRPRVLHLAFEDPAMPGSGGGAVRTREIARRLARDFDVTVVAQRWPGARERVEDGVRYRQIGLGSGSSRLGRWLGYVLLTPVVVLRGEYDLLVEDFFAPASTFGVTRLTRRPTLAVVQWFNAAEKQVQYRLPLRRMERWATRRHEAAVAVSEGLGGMLRAAHSGLRVTVIPNGVDEAAFAVAPRQREGLLFVGRLEIAQKGLDVLLEAWCRTPEQLGVLRLAGDGPDRNEVAQLAARLRIADRVELLGWVSGAAKYQLMAGSRAVVVPSRYETFGIVALEAMATGTPVVASDIPCLGEVVDGAVARLVPADDAAALAQALVEACADDDGLRRAAEVNPSLARRFTWDAAAEAQAQVYRRRLVEGVVADVGDARQGAGAGR